MFEPTFDIVDRGDYVRASAAINEIHENGAEKLNPTTALIQELVERGMDSLSLRDLDNIHAVVFPELEHNAGRYRNSEVTVGGDKTTHPEYVRADMIDLGPISVDTPDLTKWYQKFQTIHPYLDGNGRVGGIALAVISMAKCGFMIVPKGI